MKCLTILGVRQSGLDQKKNYKLTHNDVHILGLFPTKSSNGNFVEKCLHESANKIGGEFKGIIIDQGSDIRRGAKLHREQNQNTKIIHDISHKLSLVMEHTLKDNKRWMEYKKLMGSTINSVKQSNLAALAPPAQRGKDRYMEIGRLIFWPRKLWHWKKTASEAELEMYEKYYSWTEGFISELNEWQEMYELTNMIKNLVRDFGYSKEVLDYIYLCIGEALTEDSEIKLFTNECIRVVEEEVKKLKEDEVFLGSTEVLESIFGKFKETNRKSRGISGNVLSMHSYAGPKYTEVEVKEAMEKSSFARAREWIIDKVGETLSSMRRKAFSMDKI